MKVKYASDNPLTKEAAKAATGKSLEEWFEILDGMGGPPLGRKNINEFLYKDQGIDAW